MSLPGVVAQEPTVFVVGCRVLFRCKLEAKNALEIARKPPPCVCFRLILFSSTLESLVRPAMSERLRYRILVVDDDGELLAITADLLSREGYLAVPGASWMDQVETSLGEYLPQRF